MSIKALHIFLISCAVLLSIVFGIWLFDQASHNGNAVYQACGVVSLAIALGLSFYTVHFIKKIKNLA